MVLKDGTKFHEVYNKIISMRIYIFILLMIGKTLMFAQTSGNVLLNADGTVRIPDNSIAISKINTLQTALDGKFASPTAGQGVGGVVSQSGNKSNAVTLNKICGQITMAGSALAAAAEVSFVVNNNLVAATDVIVPNIQSIGTAGSYMICVSAVANGSFTITISNVSAGSLSQALVINYFVFKSVIN